jgi:hypothetical protein
MGQDPSDIQSNSSNPLFLENNISKSNDVLAIKNRLSNISVPKHLVPHKFQLKRGVDLSIIKAKDSAKTRSYSASDGEFKKERIVLSNYVENISGVRRMGRLVYQPLDEADKTF